MKYFIVLVAVIAAVVADDIYTPEQLHKMKTVTTECETSSKVTHEKIIEFRKGHFDDHDQHLKDYMFCVFKKLHWMNDDGTLEMDNIKDFIKGSTTSRNAMRPCKGMEGTGPELAYNIYKCYMQHLPTDYKYPL